MKTPVMTATDIKARGMKALTRELGPVGMARFMQQFGKGSGDYTKERHRILGDCTVDEIFDNIQKRRQRTHQAT